MVLWVLGSVAVVAVTGGLALQYAISRNGPAVLSTVDRLAGGSGGAELKATVSTGDHPQQKLLVWGAQDHSADEKRPVLLFVHGGSWKNGDPADYGFVGRAFVPEGFVVVLSGYRLDAAGAYPAMIEDTAAAIGWTRREIADFGGDPERIVVAGHSAGAYNVVMAALEERWLAAEGASAKDIAGVIGLAGPYDFYPFDSDSTKAAFGHAKQPEATQPIAHISGDAPPKLLIHGEQDTTVKIRNSRELAQRITEAGGVADEVYFPDMDHTDPLVSLAAPWRSSREIAPKMAEFARKVTADRALSVPVHAKTR